MSTRRFWLPVLLLIDLLLIISLVALVWFDNAANRGIAFDSSRPPDADGPVIGVNLFNLHLEPDSAAVTRTLQLTAHLGARYARMQVPWEDIEIHGRGDFEDRRHLDTVGAVSAWAKYDRIAAAANAVGVELIWRLDRPPAWARQQAAASPVFLAGLARDGNSTGPPDDFADYAAFVRAVVERYDGDGIDDAPGSPQVHYVQIWNEPNLKSEWNWETPKPEDFVKLLEVAATAARAASPTVTILFPGLAPTDGLDDRAPLSDLDYLDRVYQAGGAAFFDVMAAQSYGLGQPPDEHRYVFLRNPATWNWRRPIDTRNDVSRIVLLREVMELHSDDATPVWITEFGWNSAPASLPAERRRTWGEPVSEATKGAYLVGQIERARSEWPWLRVMNVWMLRYGGYAEPDPADPTPYFALVSRDWQTLPAYEALRSYSQSPPPPTQITRHWPWLWDYGPLLLVAALAVSVTATFARLFPLIDQAWRSRNARLSVSMLWLGMLLAVIIAYKGSAQLPLTLAGLALFGLLALLRPDLALLFTPLTLPLYFIPKALFDTRFGLRESGLSLPLHELLLVIATIALGTRWLWELIRRRELPRWEHWRVHLRSLVPVGLFVASAIWGLVIATDRGPALRELRWVVLEPLLFVGLAAFVATRWSQRGTGDYWLLTTQVWLIGGAVAGLVGIFQLLGLNLAPLFGTKSGFSDDSFLVEGVRRVTSLYGHPNNLGLAMGRYWPVAGGLTHWAFWSAATRRDGLRRALPYALLTTICLGGLLASFSRGAYLGAVVATIIIGVTMLPKRVSRNRTLLLSLGAVLLIAGIAVITVPALNIERLNLTGASSGVRLKTWAAALAMLRDHPLGIGLDQFGRIYPNYIDPALVNTNEIHTAHPHNLLLDLALRLGPLGLVACIWLIVRLIAQARRAIAAGGDGLRSVSVGPALMAGVAAALGGALVHGLVDQFYFWPDLALAFWLFIALGQHYGSER